jgi:hypothetical protein
MKACLPFCHIDSTPKKATVSRYTPWWRLGGEEIYLLLILDFGTRWGEWSASFHILSNSSFIYHPFVRRYIVLVSEKESLNKLQNKKNDKI